MLREDNTTWESILEIWMHLMSNSIPHLKISHQSTSKFSRQRLKRSTKLTITMKAIPIWSHAQNSSYRFTVMRTQSWSENCRATLSENWSAYQESLHQPARAILEPEDVSTYAATVAMRRSLSFNLGSPEQLHQQFVSNRELQAWTSKDVHWTHMCSTLINLSFVINKFWNYRRRLNSSQLVRCQETWCLLLTETSLINAHLGTELR